MTETTFNHSQIRKVPLPGGAAIYLRPLTASLLAETRKRCGDLMALLLDGDLATIRELAPIAPVFRSIEHSATWVTDANEILWSVELTLAAAVSWEGVVDEQGREIPKPTRQTIALLLRDQKILTDIRIALGIEILRVATESARR